VNQVVIKPDSRAGEMAEEEAARSRTQVYKSTMLTKYGVSDDGCGVQESCMTECQVLYGLSVSCIYI